MAMAPGGSTAPDIDVAIVGAGISGIGMAAHLRMLCPGRSFALFERRSALGGTWDLFRYPGVRSDSDMHTLGFAFEPWTDEKAIADGATILDYLNRVVDTRGIRPHIRFDTCVVRADWDSATARWTLESENAAGTRHLTTARWLYLGSGYYDYDDPYDAQIPGREDFAGRIVHPQFWPEDLDYAGRKVVVIGSGATAVTIVPAMARIAAHVTMLQRTPTWYITQPARDAVANLLKRLLPAGLAYRIVRFKNVRLQRLLFRNARERPEKVREYLTTRLKKVLGAHYDAAAFTPPYDPWDQRLCLVPDEDLFTAIKQGRASIVTDRIARIDATGLRLESGRHIEADVIVTATGLRLAMAGKIDLSLDGTPLNLADHFYYKATMFSNVPNLAAVFGYLNASWTLRADIIAGWVCRVLNHMDARGMEVAVPVLENPGALEFEDVFAFSSGYIERARHVIPRSATDMRWRLNQDYLHDRKWIARDPVEDGVLRFGHAGTSITAAPARLEAAE